MKKFNGFEAHLLREGLKQYVELICQDIRESESNGRRPIMTEGYILSIFADITDKLKSLTLKEK